MDSRVVDQRMERELRKAANFLPKTVQHELLPLRDMDAVDRVVLQSTREGNPSTIIGKLANCCFSILPIKLNKGVRMLVDNMIDDLIEAGWYVLESDFDLKALSNWRKEAFECVTALMGPDHTYTQYFKDFVREVPRPECWREKAFSMR